MHSALAFACSAATASCTLVPSHTVVFRQTSLQRRLQSHHFAAPLFSYSYELLFPQTLCFDNHPHCPGVGRSNSRTASVFLCALCVSVANPFFSYACSLFPRSKKVNSFAINQIQTLLRKHPGWGYPCLCDSSECSAVPLGRHLCFQQLMEMRPGRTATENECRHTGSYPAVQSARPATWTRRTHPTIIAASSRS
jgi:hypothetical protein